MTGQSGPLQPCWICSTCWRECDSQRCTNPTVRSLRRLFNFILSFTKVDEKLCLILKMVILNSNLPNPDCNNELPICVLTKKKIRFYNSKIFCNTILCTYLGYELKLLIVLWMHNRAFERSVLISHKLCSKFSYQRPQADVGYCNIACMFREGATTLGYSVWKSPTISCSSILMGCFLSWHISSLWLFLRSKISNSLKCTGQK